MGKTTGIKWTDHTFNPWWGCTKVSTGCKHCYAEGFATGRMGLPIWGQDAERRFFGDEHWKEPLRWNKAAAKTGTMARVFCASMADVFEDRPDLVEPRLRLFDLIRKTPWLRWLLLTKRPENMVRLAPPWWSHGWPENVDAGATTEDQASADERIPHLLKVPARVRFLSVEPQVGPVDLRWCLSASEERILGTAGLHTGPGISWVIQGGESGSKPRPFDLAWARSLRDQCRAAGVPYFLKQIGARPVGWWNEELGAGKHGMWRTDDSHGGDENEFPLDLRGLRTFPA